VQYHIEGDRVAGVSLHSMECYSCNDTDKLKHLFTVREINEIRWSLEKQHDELLDDRSAICLDTRRATSKDLSLT